MFKQNVGGIDRVLRIVLGIAMAVIGLFVLKGTTGTVVGIIGLIPLATGLVGFCPLYLPWKFSTNKRL
jgi:Inner membrane protein YgaP-like, transmembrane domain